MSEEAWGKAPPSIKLSRWQRFCAYFDLWVIDHGFLRALYSNMHVLPGPLYRSNQPNTGQLKKFCSTLGLKAIINLRGFNPKEGRYQLEAESCERIGVTLINVRVNSRALPSPSQIGFLKQLIEEIPLPALTHCKSGADRAGLFSALYCHFRLGQPIIEARKQLHWKYGHFRGSKTGVLDELFDSYLKYQMEIFDNQNKEDPVDFIDWIDNFYDPEVLEKNFKPRGPSKLWVDDIMKRE